VIFCQTAYQIELYTRRCKFKHVQLIKSVTHNMADYYAEKTTTKFESCHTTPFEFGIHSYAKNIVHGGTINYEY
jgi:hypothetical protein